MLVKSITRFILKRLPLPVCHRFTSIIRVFLFSFLASLTFIPCAAAAGSPDTGGHWAEKIIETAGELGIVSGYSEEVFGPDRPVSRSEFFKMAVLAGDLPVLKNTPAPAFNDLGPAHWAYPYVESAVAAKVINPGDYPGGVFSPDGPLTREEAAALAWHFLTSRRGQELPVTDPGGMQGWFTYLNEEGVITVYPGGEPGGSDLATRAEACMVALRLKERVLALEATEECRWLAGAQRAGGYFTLAASRPEVIPYFDNLTALALCDETQYREAVRKYIDWSLNRLNRPDRTGLAGTVYDYREEIEKPLVSSENYDSADSYAATLLSLAAAYYKNTGDIDFIREHYLDLSSVAAVIVTLQDPDGLVWAKPGLRVKYLMDNCECYRGLSDWAGLLASLGYTDLAALYERKAGAIKKAVETLFWNEEEACFAWAIDQEGKAHLPSGLPYPGVFAQVYPAVFGVISPDSGKAIISYRRLYRDLPDWPALQVKDPYPWAILGYAAAQMDDLAGASRFLNNCRIVYIEKGHNFPWTTFEEGFYVRTVKLLREKILSGRL
ncbi:MAG: S-layer homology domain-containing protein [Eubacteriales bacterium]